MTSNKNQGSNFNIREILLSHGETKLIPIYTDGTQPLKVTIDWTDPPGVPGPAVVDSPTIKLVHDVDLRIKETFGSLTVFQPWVLDLANPTHAATVGDNIRDNVEQVILSSPQSGTYNIQVSHKGTLTEQQAVSILVSGISLPGGTPVIDLIAPQIPTGFSGVPQNGQIVLNWVNPTDQDFQEVMLRRRTVDFPTLSTGTQVYIGANTQFTDTGLMNGTLYYYSLFSRDGVPNWSLSSSLSATPIGITVSEFKLDAIHLINKDVTSLSPKITLILNYPPGEDLDVTVNLDVVQVSNQTSVKTLQFVGTSPQSVTFDLGTDGVSSSSTMSPLQKGTSYYFKVSILDQTGFTYTTQSPLFSTQSESLSVVDFMSGPNPFNPDNGVLIFQYQLSKPATVTLSLFALNGVRIMEKRVTAGLPGGEATLNKTLTWDGKDGSGSWVPNGVYIAYLVVSDGGNTIKKVTKVAVLR